MIRLDAYIQQEIKNTYGVGLSHSFIEQFLEKGGVKLHDEIIKKKGFKFNPEVAKPVLNQKMVEAMIQVYQKGTSSNTEAKQWSDSDPLDAINIDPDKLARAGDIRPNILFENDDILVTYKPQGVLSHPGKGDQTRDSMVYQFIKYMNDVHHYIPRAGLLHRLDLDTQGILLFAKNMEAYNLLKKDFEERNIQKYYFALTTPYAGINSLVKRSIAENIKANFSQETFKELLQSEKSASEKLSVIDSIPEFQLNGFIGTVRGTLRMRFDLDKKELLRNNITQIKDCNSSVSIIDRAEEQFTAIIKPHTGRTHQIRVQAKFLGIPVENDRTYGFHITQGGILKLVAFGVRFKLKGESYSFILPLHFFRRIFSKR